MNKKTIIVTPGDTIQKLKVLAKKKEGVRRKLVVVAGARRLKAKKLAAVAKGKEDIRNKLVLTAKKLAAVAKEKEGVRRKLAAVAEQLRRSRQTLEQKVLERTKDLENIKSKSEAILASIGDGLVVVDEEGKIMYINKSFEEMLGWKEQEVINRSMVEIIPREYQNGVRVLFKESILNEVLSGRKFTVDLTNPFYFVRKDKSRFPVSIIVTPVVLRGQIIGAVETFRDITKEKEIDKAKTEFVSIASHQFKTPLAATRLLTERILNGEIGSLTEKQKEYFDDICSSNQRMINLVNALLHVSRIDLGTFTMQLDKRDVGLVMQNILAELQPVSDKKHLTLKGTSQGESTILLVDESMFRIVINNIIANAINYTPEGGTIQIEHGQMHKGQMFGGKMLKENCFTISITDTGFGIPKDQQGGLFTRFFRADNAQQEHPDGTGLGLYIVKSLLDHSGGSVWFTSEENKGTAFYVTIPMTGMAIKI